uniref:ARAD1D23518p n=1 Tax=Blastobotrys adeninivorans TaxID=409370 RepID=A0A060TAX1_BLAAD
MPVKRRSNLQQQEADSDSSSDSSSVSSSAASSSVDLATGSSSQIEDRFPKKTVNTSKRSSHHRKKKGDGRDSGDKWRLAYSKRLVFIIGIIFGLGIAWYSAPKEFVSLDRLSELSLDGLLDEFRDMLPKGIMREAHDLDKKTYALSDSFAVGNHLREEGYGVKHPVVLIPGVISTGLESWGLEGTEECPSQPHFRKRLWGSLYMLRTMLLDKHCWLKHIMLDPSTGLDPPGYKIRAALGMESADFFVPGYWLWNKILENLAAMGYDSNNMLVASYDWRLSYPDLERRDNYFSRLKNSIEHSVHSTGEKVALVGHSMGTQVIFYFLKWVEAKGYGDGGDQWVNDHIASLVDISGSTLGTPKAIVSLLSGEMKDTVQLNALAVYGLEKFFSRRERADMLRSFGGIASMLPKGGEAVWGNLTFAPDDPPITPAIQEGEEESEEELVESEPERLSFGNFIRFRNPLSHLSSKNLTIPASIDYLFEQAPEWFKNRTLNHYSYGLARTRNEVKANNDDPSKWSNPLEVALPNAPDMEIYCFYGVGKPTERSYYYQEEVDKDLVNLNISISQNDPEAVIMGEGDGTISLNTHTMCHRWKDANSKFNPGGSTVKVVEMLHQPATLDIRGGAKTAEHVDILGRTELNELVLRVAAGRGDEIEERIVSNIENWVWDIDLGDN